MEDLRGGPFDTQGGYCFSFSANYFFHFRDQTINREWYIATKGGVHSEWYIATAVHSEHDSN